MEDISEGQAKQAKKLVTTGAGIGGGSLTVAAAIASAASHNAGSILLTGSVVTGAVLAALLKEKPEMYAGLAKYLPSSLSLSSGRDWLYRLTSFREQEEVVVLGQEDYLDELEEKPDPQNVTQVSQDEPMERLQPKPPVASRRSYETGELLAPRKKRSGVFLFSQVLEQFTPSLDKIYLGTLEDGRMMFCRAEDLCHVALAGSTRGGKTSVQRMLVAQLCAAGASVLILNPHYSRYILDKKEDWTPFEGTRKDGTPYLMYPPMECRDYDVIEHYLRQIAAVKLKQRLERFAHGEPVGRPYFLVLDELPDIVKHISGASGYLDDILRQGAKVGIFLICASQDFLVKTLKLEGGAVRECYRSAYYVGGDATTAKTLLDMPANEIDESILGKGTVMLRNWQVVPSSVVAYVPLVDNAALYRLLGPSTFVPDEQIEQDEEDDLVSYLLTPEKHTEALPVQRRHVPVSSYEQHRQRLASRKTPVYARQASTQVVIPETPRVEAPESGLKPDEQSVLEAYQSGLKSGNAIAGMTGISATRVNQCLNKLSAMKLIDWQPKAKA